MQFFFIRHGQSTNNEKYAREGVQFERHADPQMTELGVKQAQALADFLSQPAATIPSDHPVQIDRSGFGFTHLYTSLMIRAVHTTVILGQKLGLTPVAWPEAHERGGIYLADPENGQPVGLPGNSTEFFFEQFPELKLPAELAQGGWWGQPYESREQSRQRAQVVVEQLIDRHGQSEDRVALVSHGGFFQELMAAALGVPTFGAHWLMLHNTGMTRLDYAEGEFVIQYLNRLDWLSPQLIS